MALNNQNNNHNNKDQNHLDQGQILHFSGTAVTKPAGTKAEQAQSGSMASPLLTTKAKTISSKGKSFTAQTQL